MMEKKDWMMEVSLALLNTAMHECDQYDSVDSLADECIKAAEKIWKAAHPLEV